MRRTDGPPERHDALFKNLFGDPSERTYELIADGLCAITQNTSRLLTEPEDIEPYPPLA